MGGIHNAMEDLVMEEVSAVYDSLGPGDQVCTCNQCRQDAACYVLNRVEPRYVVSHRGMARAGQAADQQARVDLTALVYEAIRRISHNKRPYFKHGENAEQESGPDTPAFNIPAIMGRVFNGHNFSPAAGIKTELLQNGNLAAMKDNNWHNPYILIAGTNGAFTFWPKPVAAAKAGLRGMFEYTLRIAAPEFETLSHVFSIPVVSEAAGVSSPLSRTFKLPDLFLFPPGEEDQPLTAGQV